MTTLCRRCSGLLCKRGRACRPGSRCNLLLLGRVLCGHREISPLAPAAGGGIRDGPWVKTKEKNNNFKTMEKQNEVIYAAKLSFWLVIL